MGDKLPPPTARLIKRARRLAKKLQDVAPRQGAETVSVPAVLVRAVTNVLWQTAGRLEDDLRPVKRKCDEFRPDHNGECLNCDEWADMHKHESHVTRVSMGASTYDFICENCGATDSTGGGWGALAQPCPNVPEPQPPDDLTKQKKPPSGVPREP